MQKKYKILFHIDLDAFFCAVQEIRYPFLRGKAFAIGREKSRGVIATASYAARKYGLKSAMPVHEAIRRCPKVILVSGGGDLYAFYSNKFKEYLAQYATVMNIASIDECYMDVTEYTKNIHPVELAKKIQKDLWNKYRLSASIGIAPTVYLSKMASELKKPKGITILRIREIEKILYPNPIDTIYGLGKKSSQPLKEAGILTIGDFLSKANKENIHKIIGFRYYEHLVQSLSGKTTSIIESEYKAEKESMSTSTTFPSDLVQFTEISNEFAKMAMEITEKLRAEKKLIKNVRITLRYPDFKTITRCRMLRVFTDDYEIINNCVQSLFEDNYNDESIRLIGVGLSKFAHEEKEERISLFDLN